MPLLDELTQRMKDAMRAKDSRTRDLLRMVKSRVKERETSPSFSGEVDDALVLDVIREYVKQMAKAAAQYAEAGDSAAALREQAEFEVAYLTPFLPQKLDAEATAALVVQAAEAQGIADPKQIGRLIGAVMKAHKDAVDPALVRAAAEAHLSG